MLAKTNQMYRHGRHLNNPNQANWILISYLSHTHLKNRTVTLRMMGQFVCGAWVFLIHPSLFTFCPAHTEGAYAFSFRFACRLVEVRLATPCNGFSSSSRLYECMTCAHTCEMKVDKVDKVQELQTRCIEIEKILKTIKLDQKCTWTKVLACFYGSFENLLFEHFTVRGKVRCQWCPGCASFADCCTNNNRWHLVS